jgi:hypothetical protein
VGDAGDLEDGHEPPESTLSDAHGRPRRQLCEDGARDAARSRDQGCTRSCRQSTSFSLILALLLLGIPGALCLAIGAWHFVVPDKVDQGAVIGPSFGGAMSLGALLVLTRGLAWYRLSRRENLAARPPG